MTFRILPENDSRSCCDGDIAIVHDAWCEHCSGLQPYDPMYCDGGTWWCEICFGAMEDIPASVKKQVKAEVKDRARAHYQRKLAELDKE